MIQANELRVLAAVVLVFLGVVFVAESMTPIGVLLGYYGGLILGNEYKKTENDRS